MDGSISSLDAMVVKPVPMAVRAQAGGAMLAALGFAALSSIPLATMLIGPNGVAFVNEAAEGLLAKQDGLLLCGTYGLSTSSRVETRHLHGLIENAIHGGDGGRVPIARGRSPLPLLVSVAPLRDQLFGASIGSSGFALVLIHDPLAGCAASGRKSLVDLYGLTDAEACVAVAIVSGRNAKRIASMRNVSVPTVRTQIRQILVKTGCCDQREFISRFGWLGVAM